MNDKKWFNKVFWEEIVECYMLADLSKLEADYDSSNKCGNCNFPLALQILSCMDFLGWLISNPVNHPRDTSKNIVSFSALFTPRNAALIKELNEFVDLFRHGLSHEYFAKGCGISRQGKDLLSLDMEKESINLDADILLGEFRQAIVNLKTAVNKEPKLASKIRQRYGEVQDSNSLVRKGLIAKSIGKDTVTRSTSLNLPIHSSNASVAPPSTTFPPRK